LKLDSKNREFCLPKNGDFCLTVTTGVVNQRDQRFAFIGTAPILNERMPGDNAWSESFFATMKKKLIHWANYGTKKSVWAAVFEYIYCFYNVKRIQKRL